jgi:hypothetical protein
MIKLTRILLVITCVMIANSVFSQTSKPDIARIYEEAERLYKNGNYSASLEYLRRESGDWLGMSDTLMYLKIKNLENLYRTNFNSTKDLEVTLQRFFSRVNKNTFPELKYSEVTSIYTNFQSFKERDKIFYDSVSGVLDINKTAALGPIRQVTADYLKAYPNTYYSTQLNGYVNNINTKLTQVEIARKKMEKDSLNRDALKKVGKLLTINLTYSAPQGGKTVFGGLDTYSEVLSFYNGTYTGPLGEKYSLGASLAETFINIYTGSRAKLGLNWSIFDAEYTVFDWSGNTLISESQTSKQPVKELKSIKAGTRLGPVIAILATKSMSVAFYYSARPGVQFLTGKTYFNAQDGTTMKTYEIKPSQTNFNLSNEVGLKFYFFKKLFVSPYLHFGKYNWQNEITDITTGGAGAKIETQADYKFKFIGIRLGF